MARIDGLRPAATSSANSSAARTCNGSMRSTASDASATAGTIDYDCATRTIIMSSSWLPTGSLGHCPLLSLWCVEESGCLGFHLDVEALALSAVDVDGGQLAVSDLLEHGGAG